MLPWIHPLISGNERWGGGKESERTRERGKSEEREGGPSREVKMEAPSAAWRKVLIKRKNHKQTRGGSSAFFHFATTNPRRVLSVSLSGVKTYLPITDRGGIEGKFAVGVIFRVCFDLSDLPPACVCPSNTKGWVGGESGKIIQLFKLGYATNSLSRLTVTTAAS